MAPGGPVEATPRAGAAGGQELRYARYQLPYTRIYVQGFQI